MGFFKKRNYEYVNESEYKSVQRELSIQEILGDKKEVKRLKKWLKFHKPKPRVLPPPSPKGNYLTSIDLYNLTNVAKLDE